MVRAKARKTVAALPDNSRVILDQLVTPEARAQGLYEIGTASVTEGEHGPAEKGERSVVINRGVDTIARWHASGVLDDRQMAAVSVYRRAHALHFGAGSRTTMTWSVTGSIRGALTAEDLIANGLEAKEDIERFDAAIFARLPRHYFEVWQNVVLYDEPLGLAGSRLGFAQRHAGAAGVQAVIRLLCDLICVEWRL